MENVSFNLISDKKKAEELWQHFSKNKTAYDDWQFRNAFHAPTDFPLYFYSGSIKNELIGFLPLQHNTKKNFLEFFAGSFMEYNHVFLKDGFEEYANNFYLHVLKNAQKNILLRDMSDTTPDLLDVEEYDSTFTLKLKEFGSLESLLEKRFSSKSRGNLRKKMRKIDENNIEIIENNLEDIDLLMDLNQKRFGEESSFADKSQRESFHLLLNLPLKWLLQTFIVNGKKESVSLSLIYKNIFMYIMAGTDLENVPNLGSYVITKVMEKAFASEADILDAGRNPSGWKDRWHLDAAPAYRLVQS
ncbi:GNAT family N-acetyltransferase [Patescibacteria group bacterium]|nr:GNAT family N-acetyltransferase [Patescibacteria group bacterium]